MKESDARPIYKYDLILVLWFAEIKISAVTKLPSFQQAPNTKSQPPRTECIPSELCAAYN